MRTTTKLENHQLYRYLIPISVKFISRQTPTEIISKPTIEELYIIDILHSTSKINECIDQIYFSIEMISGFRKRKNLTMNRHDHIVYMVENFYLRITSIFDRALRFCNSVFELGIPEKECRESTIIKNKKIIGTPIELSLRKLKKQIDKFRPIRNKVAHSETFRDEKLDTIESFYYLMELEDTEDIKKFGNVYKTDTDRYVKMKKQELREFAEEIDKIIVELYDSITPTVESRSKNKLDEKLKFPGCST